MAVRRLIIPRQWNGGALEAAKRALRISVPKVARLEVRSDSSLSRRLVSSHPGGSCSPHRELPHSLEEHKLA